MASDTNGVNDVYEWEANGTGSCHSEAQNGGCLYLLSGGTSPQPSYFGDAGANGDDAFFFTYQRLVGQDKDELQDVYDARVGGGLAAQNPSPAPPCLGEACRTAGSAAPESRTAGSSTFSGPADPKPLRCKKHFKRVLRHGKAVCVKAKPHKQGHRKGHKRVNHEPRGEK